MTPSEIAALPDRELDALVAERVMGWRRSTRQWAGFKRGALLERNKEFCHQEYDQAVRYIDKHGVCRWVHALPAYSTDPRAMMEVLAHMENAHGADVDFFTGYDNKQKRYHQVHFHGDLSADTESDVCGIARLPRMVAEAALLAVRARGKGEKQS